MKLLLMYMYRGEVHCPQEDLYGLLRTAASLQIRGLVELERRRGADGYLLNSVTGSPIKKSQSDQANVQEGALTTSDGVDYEVRRAVIEGDPVGNNFNIDEVRNRLHGQLDIQAISQPNTSGHNGNNGHHHHPQARSSSNEGWPPGFGTPDDVTPPPQAHTTTRNNGSSESGPGSEGARDSDEQDRDLRGHGGGPSLPHHLHPHQTIRHLPYNNSRASHKHRDPPPPNHLMGGHGSAPPPPLPLPNGTNGGGRGSPGHWPNNNGGLERNDPFPHPHHPPTLHHGDRRGGVDMAAFPGRDPPYQHPRDEGRRLGGHHGAPPAHMSHPTLPLPGTSSHHNSGRGGRGSSSSSSVAAAVSKDLINVARAAGLNLEPSDPQSPLSNLLAAAKFRGDVEASLSKVCSSSKKQGR